jgi:4-hydroxy-tetrahydrodipicolinate reductase
MKIALLGYGKMGKTIERLAKGRGHSIVYKSASETSIGNINEADVAIDFSTQETAAENIKSCLKLGIPVVSGTTGWLENFNEVIKFCEERNGSFIYASNFSIGVNLFFNLNEQLARIMQPWDDYKVSIEETHHIQKKDAPSGTAITIAEGIMKHSNKTGWRLKNASEEEIEIIAKRIDNVNGLHEVVYTSDIDSISIKHEAHSREGFAIGALLASEWLQSKKGVFTMKDVLSLGN